MQFGLVCQNVFGTECETPGLAAPLDDYLTPCHMPSVTSMIMRPPCPMPSVTLYDYVTPCPAMTVDHYETSCPRTAATINDYEIPLSCSNNGRL